MQIGPSERVGQTYGGLRVERLLGRGGMGSVYAARGRSGAPVVIKFMEAALDPKQRRRFQREGEALLRVRSHPNVVSVHHLEMDTEVPYLVMDLIEGLPLSGLVQRRGPLPARDAARIAAQVARGLAVVHAYGLIHRDVKPDNVVVTPSGRACLVDFGVAKDQFQTSLTQGGQLIGTAPYIAPELWEGERPTPAADLFSLGATLYQMSVGRPPFAGQELTELSEVILEGDYPRPSEVVAEFSPALEQVILQALEPELRFRYRDAEELAADLERVERGEGPSAPALARADGSKVVLLGWRRVRLGSGSASDVPVPGAGVLASHAELRRTAGGYALADLSGGATRVNGQAPAGLEVLADGARIDLGGASLWFSDPRGREHPLPLVPADPWQPAPSLVLDALIEVGDGRAVAEALSRLVPSRAAEERARAALAGLLEPEGLEALLSERRAVLEAGRGALLRALTVASGKTLGAETTPWLLWWDRSRARAPAQLGGAGQARPHRLEALGSEAALTLDGSGGVVIGRDARCHLSLDDKTVSRLHASLVPHHERWLLRDEGSSYGVKVDEQRVEVALVDAGSVLRVGDVRLRLTGAPAPAAVVDSLTLRLLQGRGHPASARSLVQALEAEADLAWSERVARGLFAEEGTKAAAFAGILRRHQQERAKVARAWLPTLLGGVPGSLAACESLLQARAGALGVQVRAEEVAWASAVPPGP